MTKYITEAGKVGGGVNPKGVRKQSPVAMCLGSVGLSRLGPFSVDTPALRYIAPFGRGHGIWPRARDECRGTGSARLLKSRVSGL